VNRVHIVLAELRQSISAADELRSQVAELKQSIAAFCWQFGELGKWTEQAVHWSVEKAHIDSLAACGRGQGRQAPPCPPKPNLDSFMPADVPPLNKPINPLQPATYTLRISADKLGFAPICCKNCGESGKCSLFIWWCTTHSPSEQIMIQSGSCPTMMDSTNNQWIPLGDITLSTNCKIIVKKAEFTCRKPFLAGTVVGNNGLSSSSPDFIYTNNVTDYIQMAFDKLDKIQLSSAVPLLDTRLRPSRRTS
jgi:hypothetical protein